MLLSGDLGWRGTGQVEGNVPSPKIQQRVVRRLRPRTQRPLRAIDHQIQSLQHDLTEERLAEGRPDDARPPTVARTVGGQVQRFSTRIRRHLQNPKDKRVTACQPSTPHSPALSSSPETSREDKRYPALDIASMIGLTALTAPPACLRGQEHSRDTDHGNSAPARNLAPGKLVNEQEPCAELLSQRDCFCLTGIQKLAEFQDRVSIRWDLNGDPPRGQGARKCGRTRTTGPDCEFAVHRRRNDDVPVHANRAQLFIGLAIAVRPLPLHGRADRSRSSPAPQSP